MWQRKRKLLHLALKAAYAVNGSLTWIERLKLSCHEMILPSHNSTEKDFQHDMPLVDNVELLYHQLLEASDIT